MACVRPSFAHHLIKFSVAASTTAAADASAYLHANAYRNANAKHIFETHMNLLTILAFDHECTIHCYTAAVMAFSANLMIIFISLLLHVNGKLRRNSNWKIIFNFCVHCVVLCI